MAETKTVKKSTRKSSTKAPAGSAQSITQGRTWRALATHYQKLKKVHLRTLFAQDPHAAGA